MGEFIISLGRWAIGQIVDLGGLGILTLRTFSLSLPLRLGLFFKQAERIGVRSLPVVALSSAFIGMVFALETFYALRKFGAETMVGASLALALARELAPVFTAVMLTARAGAAMAAEIGTMRVTEQIDALEAMAVNPISYLIVPRVWAFTLMTPVLTVFSNLIGIGGGYLVGVKLLGIHEGAFVSNIERYLETEDISFGLIKATVFGFLAAMVCCYEGYTTQGGAEGVGKATTRSVVRSLVIILIADYILTAFLP